MKATETRNTEAITVSRAEYELYQAQSERISVLEKQVELLTEALRLSRRKRFGVGSERASEEVMDQLSLLFNEAEVYADKAVKADGGSVAVAAHKRRKKNEYTLDHLPEDVPVEVVEHRLRLEGLVCPGVRGHNDRDWERGPPEGETGTGKIGCGGGVVL